MKPAEHAQSIVDSYLVLDKPYAFDKQSQKGYDDFWKDYGLRLSKEKAIKWANDQIEYLKLQYIYEPYLTYNTIYHYEQVIAELKNFSEL